MDKRRVEEFADLLHLARIVNEAEQRADVDPYVERKHGGATREGGTLPSGKRCHCNRLVRESGVGTQTTEDERSETSKLNLNVCEIKNLPYTLGNGSSGAFT